MYAQHVSTKITPQTEQAHPLQVENSAGGFSFAVDCWKRLDRFLILGAEGGTYYASERKLTKENAKCIQECLDENPTRAIGRIVEVSTSGRAPKNDPAIFALALAAAHNNPVVRQLALSRLPGVCRTGHHILDFVESVTHLRGFGRSLRRAVGNWYMCRSDDDLAYQMVKYQQRDGWAQRDVLRLCHPKGGDNPALRWATGKLDETLRAARAIGHDDLVQACSVLKLPGVIAGFERAKTDCTPELVRAFRLTHEMIPTEAKNSPDIWAALLENMPFTAMLRNLGKMTNVGLVAPLSDASRRIISQLGNTEVLKRARVHPLAILVAMRTYAGGHGIKGNLTWNPDPRIVDALDDAFYASFGHLESTGKNTLLALDVSGSMGGGVIAGLPGISPRVAAACMSMVAAKTEQNWQIVGFTSGSGGSRWCGHNAAISVLDISPKMRLNDVCDKINRVDFGGTDCSLPMTFCKQNKLPVDIFQIFTDNETWAGMIHPHQALKEYRQSSGRPAKLVVQAFASNGFSIANPLDSGMLDVVGCDTATPQIVRDFAME